MLKMSPQLAGVLPATGINNSKIVRSTSENDRKLAKSDFTKLVHRAEKHNFLTPDARQTFNQLRQAFTEAPILRHFDFKRYIQIKTNAFGYAIGGVFSQMTSETD